MTNFTRQIVAESTDLAGESETDANIGNVALPTMPHEYKRILSIADGFVGRKGLFRFFGTKPLGGLPDVAFWNRSPWKLQYGGDLQTHVIIAEDVFGDQYCLPPSMMGGALRIRKFYCEGGKWEDLSFDRLDDFVLEALAGKNCSLYDHELVSEAFQVGLRPTVVEHLAFRLPLIVGGEYALSNLGVEPASLHLGILAQMTARNSKLGDGTRINKFVE